jgi:hypothetical protein
MADAAVVPRPSFTRALGIAAAVVLGWALVALVLAAQAHFVSASQGRPQPWWPSFGYALAIFSIWAALTWPVVLAVRRVERAGLALAARLAIYATGLPLVTALHVGLFALAYWPLYSDGGRIPSRWAMAERMFVRNLDTDALIYAALVALAAIAGRRLAQPPVAAPGAPLRVRVRGGLRLVPLEQIRWIGAAGNYAELHTEAGVVLLEESLTSLTGRLPPEAFARVHRGAIVRLERVASVRSLGRGDAELELLDGARLRLSRRYRGALADWLARSSG